MTTKNKQGAARSKQKPYKWVGHIEVNFNDDERKHAIKYCDERTPDVEDAIVRLTQSGTGVKFTYTESNDSYRGTLQPKTRDSIYYGYTLGCNHRDLERLVQLLLYIAYELMENSGVPLPNNGDVNDW